MQHRRSSANARRMAVEDQGQVMPGAHALIATALALLVSIPATLPAQQKPTGLFRKVGPSNRNVYRWPQGGSVRLSSSRDRPDGDDCRTPRACSRVRHVINPL